MTLITRYFSFDEVKAEQGWMLLNWCRSQGADEFTITGLVAGTESERMRTFFNGLASAELPRAPRRLLSAPSADKFTRETSLWKLNAATIGLLQAALPMGFTSREYDDELWLEDLAIYRDGRLMMGVLSHENGGVLRLTAAELTDLRTTGFPDRDEVPWVGY